MSNIAITLTHKLHEYRCLCSTCFTWSTPFLMTTYFLWRLLASVASVWHHNYFHPQTTQVSLPIGQHNCRGSLGATQGQRCQDVAGIIRYGPSKLTFPHAKEFLHKFYANLGHAPSNVCAGQKNWKRICLQGHLHQQAESVGN